MRGSAASVTPGRLFRLPLGSLRERPVGGPVEVIRQLPKVLDQAPAFLCQLLDVRVDLLVIRVGVLAYPTRIRTRLGADSVGLLACLCKDLFGVGPHLGAV